MIQPPALSVSSFSSAAASTCYSFLPAAPPSFTSKSLQVNLATLHEQFCFLWVEGWSSWIYILHFFGFTHIYIIQNEFFNFMHVLRDHYTFTTWSFSQLSQWLELHSDADPLFVFEGSKSQVLSWWNVFQTLSVQNASVCVMLKQRARSFHFLKGFKWTRLHHHFDGGGATTASYQIGFSPSFHWIPLSDLETRWDLHDCLSSTLYGSVAEAPTQSPYLLSTMLRSHMLLAPSVFSISGCVHLHITHSELLRVFDVPKSLDATLLSSTDSFLESDMADSVSLSVPGKVMLRVMKHLGFQPSTSKRGGRPVSAVSDFSAQIRGDFNPITEQATDVHISVKADDAAVPVGLWNSEIFAGSGSQVTYDPLLHDAPLEHLRDAWGMRWFRKRLFASFTRYMRSSYGLS